VKTLLAVVLAACLIVGCAAPGGQPAAATAPPAGTPAAGAAAGCGTPVHFTVRLNFVLDDEQVPYFTAVDKGWYKEQCLDPEFQAGTGSTNTVQLVGNGSADMGIADTVAILVGQANGLDLQAFGVVYQHNPTAFLIRQAALSPDQLQADKPSADLLYGKTYGAVIAGSPFIFYKAFLQQQGLDGSKIRQVNISPPGFTEMQTGQVDFIATFFTTAPVLEGLGVPLKVFKLEDYGQKAYGLSYFSTPKWIGDHGDVVRKFLQVTQRSIEYTNQNPEEGVKLLCNHNQALCADDKAFQTNVAEQKLQIPLYDNLVAGKPMFCADANTWKATAQLLVDSGTIQSLPDLSKSYTNDYITGC
jgi:NitT/TauT family transport system substrate-binding protein